MLTFYSVVLMVRQVSVGDHMVIVKSVRRLLVHVMYINVPFLIKIKSHINII